MSPFSISSTGTTTGSTTSYIYTVPQIDIIVMILTIILIVGIFNALIAVTGIIMKK